MPAARRGKSMTEAHHFEAFMRNYQNMVFSTAFRLVANQAEAEDISQEVFLKAYERYDQLRDSPTVGGWCLVGDDGACPLQRLWDQGDAVFRTVMARLIIGVRSRR